MQLPAVQPCPLCDQATPTVDMARHRATVCPEAPACPVHRWGGLHSAHGRTTNLVILSVYWLSLNFPIYNDHHPLPSLCWATISSGHSGPRLPPWTPGCTEVPRSGEEPRSVEQEKSSQAVEQEKSSQHVSLKCLINTTFQPLLKIFFQMWMYMTKDLWRGIVETTWTAKFFPERCWKLN